MKYTITVFMLVFLAAVCVANPATPTPTKITEFKDITVDATVNHDPDGKLFAVAKDQVDPATVMSLAEGTNAVLTFKEASTAMDTECYQEKDGQQYCANWCAGIFCCVIGCREASNASQACKIQVKVNCPGTVKKISPSLSE